MSQTTYYQRNIEVILNRAKRYYRDNIEELREKGKNKYRELSEEEKDIKREYGRNRYHNMSEEDKQRKKEYQRNDRESERSPSFFLFCIFFYYIKMGKEFVFKIKNNSYTKDKYYFQKGKNQKNINQVDTEKIVLSNKAPHGEQGANKYSIAYISSALRRYILLLKI